MANIYVKNTGSNTNPYDTWAKAATTIGAASAIANPANPDTIWISNNHAESSASAISCAIPGWTSSTGKALCGNDGATPPTALAATASVTSTGNSYIAPIANGGNYVYVYGVIFNCGTGAVSPMIALKNGAGIFENCAFNILATGAGAVFQVGNENILRNCNVKFSAAGQHIEGYAGIFKWQGGALVMGTSPTTLITSNDVGFHAFLEDVDLSAAGSGMNLCDISGYHAYITLRNCKLPSGWNGALASGAVTSPGWVEMHNCDSGNTNYRFARQTRTGTISQQTGTLTRSGGASDGTTTYSWKMISTANAKDSLSALPSLEMVEAVDTTGSSKTVTVELLHDSVTALTNADVYMELEYLGTSSYPLGVHATTEVDKVTTPTSVTASSATWDTTGMSNPNKQKLAITFTPQLKGYIHAKVFLAKASKTIYVDPVLTVA